MVKLILLLSLMATGKTGIGTVFGSSTWDAHNPHSNLACMHREIDDRELVVAHNTLPCHSLVWIYNLRTGRSVVATVGDRGPRRAMIDMSPAVARRIGHNGMERVLMVPLPSGSTVREVDDRKHRRHPHRKVRKKQRVA
ncbi:MAG: hypothetical protein EXR72_02090 [Myxococcales bacterium]|nr:hypothetical protein [Myxococcales bacterium]